VPVLPITTLDYVFIAILAISALIGVLRGLVKEALSLLGWVAAAWLAMRYGNEGGRVVAGLIDDPDARLWAGRLIIFVAILFATALLTWLVGYLVRLTPMTGMDRVLGLCFGLARGTLLVALVVYALRAGGFDGEPWWRNSKLLPYATAVSQVLEQAVRSRLAAGARPSLAPA
jgi:membrane protein required for colicin V production